MTIFYVVRHGKTLFNQKGLVQGWCDSPLTEEGISMAKQLREGLKDVSFSLGICSTSERAMDTLDDIVQNDVPKKLYKGLKEMNFGDFEGSVIADTMANGLSDSYEDIGGESIKGAVDRFKKTLQEVGDEHPNENVLVVSHGAVIYYLLDEIVHDAMNGKGLPAVAIPNCSVTVFEYQEGTFIVKEWPTTDYLKGNHS